MHSLLLALGLRNNAPLLMWLERIGLVLSAVGSVIAGVLALGAAGLLINALLRREMSGARHWGLVTVLALLAMLLGFAYVLTGLDALDYVPA